MSNLSPQFSEHEDRYGKTYDSLDDLAGAGFVTDEWSKWQQGGCGTYACTLQQENPNLRFGALYRDEENTSSAVHFFAHDDERAYDSAGQHPLPYRGISGGLRPSLDEKPEWHSFDFASDEGRDPSEALAHIRGNRILPLPSPGA